MVKRPLPIRWSKRALDSLEKILAYIAQDNPKAAKDLRDGVLEGLENARSFPEGFRVVPELRNPVVREVLREPIRAVYQIREDELRVLMVRRMEQAPIEATKERKA